MANLDLGEDGRLEIGSVYTRDEQGRTVDAAVTLAFRGGDGQLASVVNLTAVEAQHLAEMLNAAVRSRASVGDKD